jgi:transposase
VAESAADVRGAAGRPSAERRRAAGAGRAKAAGRGPRLPAIDRAAVRFSADRGEKSEASLLACAKASPEIARLRTLPGIGHILGAPIGGEIGDLKRCASADALVNHTGRVSSLYESGEVTPRGSITRQGAVGRRGALGAAANAAVKGHPRFAEGSRALRRRSQEPRVANGAVARSRACCIYGF